MAGWDNLSGKAKVDLHTHCSQMTSAPNPNASSVKRILAQVERRGLDGIAITEHNDRDYGYRVQQIAESCFGDKSIVIPGQELRIGSQHIVELYLPDNSVFAFWAHPNFSSLSVSDFIEENLGRIQGIEVRNSCHVLDTERIADIAKERGLLLLANSDAHTLDTIGYFYNEIDMSELLSGAGKRLNRVG